MVLFKGVRKFFDGLWLGEDSSPPVAGDAGFGKLYVKTSDTLPYFLTSSGVEYSLTDTGPSSLSGLDDVTTSAEISGQNLVWNGSVWENQTSPAGITDHTLLTNIGTNTHDQIDTHLADSSIHMETSGAANEVAYFATSSGVEGATGVTFDGSDLQTSSSVSFIPLGSGTNSVRVGPTAVSDSTRSVAVGFDARAQADDAVAVGWSYATSGGAIGIGTATASFTDTIAIGTNAVARLGPDNLAIGTNTDARSTGGGSIAIGNTYVDVNGLGAIGIGGAKPTESGATSASADYAVALGNFARAQAVNAIAIGGQADDLTGTLVSSASGIALGAGAVVASNQFYSVALGTGATTTTSGQLMLGGDGTADSPVLDLYSYGFQAMAELDSTPSTVSGFGQFYVKTDNKPYFQDDAGTEYDLTSGAGGGLAGSGVAQEVAYFADGSTVSGITGVTWDGSTLQLSDAVEFKPLGENTWGNSVRIGQAAVASNTGSIAIGNSADSLGDSSIALGVSAYAGAADNIAIGSTADTNTSTRGIAIGYQADVGNGTSTICIGTLAISAAIDNGIAIGGDARALHQNGVAIGKSAWTTAEDQLRLGTVTDPLNISTFGHIAMSGIATPSTVTDFGQLYVKTDNLLYYQDDGGTEYDLTAGGGVGPATINEFAYFDTTTTVDTLSGFRVEGTTVILNDGVEFLPSGVGDESIVIGIGPTAGDNSVAIGSSAAAGTAPAGANNVAIGNQADCGAGTEVVAIGYVASGGTNTVAIGNNATALGGAGSQIAIGQDSNADGGFAVAVGYQTDAAGAAVAVGDQAKASASNNIAIGDAAQVTVSTHMIAIGTSAANVGASAAHWIGIGRQATGGAGSAQSIAIGYLANTSTHPESLALGRSAACTTSGQATFGSASYPVHFDLHPKTTPSVTAAHGAIYPKTDGKLYFKYGAAAEIDLTATGGGDPTVTSVISGNYSATIGELVRCDCTASGFTVTLPTSSGVSGQSVYVKNDSAGENTITVSGLGVGETIDGATTTSMTTAREALRFVSFDGTWGII